MKKARSLRLSALALIPFLAIACLSDPEPEQTGATDDAVKPSTDAAKKRARHADSAIDHATCPNGALPGAMPGCAAPSYAECLYDSWPYCCVCSDPCATVLCAPGHACEPGCEGEPVCNPTVCEGFAGLTCQDGFDCKKASNNPDEGGTCVQSCGEECGECVSNEDCSDLASAAGQAMVCTTSAGECLSSCDCPLCDVCAGHCVPATDAAQ